MDQRLKCKTKTIKVLEANMGVTLHDLGLSNEFLDMTPKALPTEEKNDKLDFIQIKNFSMSKDIIKKVKRQHTEWENICKPYI